MTFQEFDNYSNDLLSKVTRMRDTKGREYAGEKDRFDNFNRLAVKCGNLDRKLIWLVYFTKHIDAIESFISNGREFSTESIEGRIVDAVTYLTLLAGMIKEDKEQKFCKCGHLLTEHGVLGCAICSKCKIPNKELLAIKGKVANNVISGGI